LQENLSWWRYGAIEQWKDFPLKKFTAKMANMSQTITTTIITLKIEPTDSIKAATIIFIAMLWLITLNGLNALNNLKILKNYISPNNSANIKSNNEVITIKKSS